MLDNIRIIAALVFIVLGIFFEVCAVCGVLRYRFVLNKLQVSTIGDTLALFLVILGLCLLNGLNLTTVKLMLIVALLWCASPVSGHLISNVVTTVSGEEVGKECEEKEL